jgi:cytochrome b561
MATTTNGGEWQPRINGIGDGARYTKVAIYLHWAIAVFIIYNLISGLLVWDLAKDFFKANRLFYIIGLITHMSAGMTVLLLTVVRIAWRLLHEPPPHSPEMKPWEVKTSHVAHFLLYAGMVLMPLSGWAILSAHPPAGTPGAEIAAVKMAAMSPAAAPAAAADAPPGAAPAAAPKPKMPPPPKIWWLIPLPPIAPIADIGITEGGVGPQDILHGQFAEWHQIGGYMMIILFLLHIAGALKHQIIDKHASLQRMGVGRRKP